MKRNFCSSGRADRVLALEQATMSKEAFLLRILFLCFCSTAICSCNRQEDNLSMPRAAWLRSLPDERIIIHGGAQRGGFPTGFLQTVWGAKPHVQPGEGEIGLMHLLIFPPASAESDDSTIRGDTDPNFLEFKWNLNEGKSVNLQILYYPGEHAIEVRGRQYKLSEGNLFVIKADSDDRVDVKQLQRTMFDCLNPGDTVRAFKSECKDDERVQRFTP